VCFTPYNSRAEVTAFLPVVVYVLTTAEVKLIGYHIRRNENETAYLKVGEVLEKIEDMQTLVRTESQD